ncbi:hypothetical protein [Agaribacterium haliotis]|uniref:PGAP1-like alpha/beta domain-containing protein n=1 Tax=Agaribacterium haliotis TaxID=2013869 RepID=UPI000BB57144|nr:hypothetical protein [Agaribacterium haliotis]
MKHGSVLAVIWMLISAHVAATECNDISDFYSAEGCTVTARSEYIGFGEVDVKVVSAGNGSQLNRVAYVVGPYEADTAISGNEPLGLEHIPSGFKQSASASGVDIVYLDYSRMSDDYLQNKAMALVAAIDRIESLQTQQTKSVMLGLSLGGVVARYALTTMESNNNDHGVAYYISYDSPHKGAHTPVSLQYLPKFLRDAFKQAKDDNNSWFFQNILDLSEWFSDDLLGHDLRLSEELGEAVRDLNKSIATADFILDKTLKSPVGRQLIVQNLFYGYSMHADGLVLQTELDKLGFPESTKQNIAVANGAITGRLQDAGESNMYLYYRTTNKDTNDNELWFEVFQQGSKTAGSLIFNGELIYEDASDGLSGGDGTDNYKKEEKAYSSLLHFDDVPCSTSVAPEQIAATLDEQFEKEWSNPYSNKVQVRRQTSCFIPTISALAIDAPLDSTGPVSDYVTPFDLVIGGPANAMHLTSYQESDFAMRDQINAMYQQVINDTYNYPWLIPVLHVMMN